MPGTRIVEAGEADRRAGDMLRDRPKLLRWRSRDAAYRRLLRIGDRIAPLGLQGSKSLQDLFTARRVPRRERAAVPVVESEGEIVWVAGVATSERFKVTDSTGEAVRLSVRRGRPPRS